MLSKAIISLQLFKIAGEIGNRKRVAVPGVALSLPPVSEQDEADLRFGCQQGVDFVAASFMQRGKDIVAIRRILESEKKISRYRENWNAEGVKNIDEILEVADGLMVARGDLGVEIPAEEVPVLQKMMMKNVITWVNLLYGDTNARVYDSKSTSNTCGS